VQVYKIKVANGFVEGYKVDMDNAPLILVKAKRGFVMCGYLNIEAAKGLGDAAARVTGVRSFEDLLAAHIVDVTERAEALGVVRGMTGKAALEKFNE